MKTTKLITNIVFAVAGTFFVTGAVTQNSSMKDLSIGTLLLTSLVKQEEINKNLNRFATKQKLSDWQNDVCEKIENTWRSLEDTKKEFNSQHQELESRVGTLDNYAAAIENLSQRSQQIEAKLEKHFKAIDQNKHQLKAQEKQQTNMRSQLDRQEHRLRFC
ncbi:hypothetical protein [Myxosarcina sp. GI1(2024)]